MATLSLRWSSSSTYSSRRAPSSSSRDALASPLSTFVYDVAVGAKRRACTCEVAIQVGKTAKSLQASIQSWLFGLKEGKSGSLS